MYSSPSTSLKYQRLLVKLSGEALQGKQESGIDPHYLQQYTLEIAHAVKAGITIAIVVGGGNYCRGAKLVGAGIKRATADQMGILATLMNGLALRDALQQHDIATQVMSAIAVPGLAAPFDRSAALDLLQQGTVVICVAGTGNPFFTTDTTASLRAIELEMQLLLKATRVDGVYSAEFQQNLNGFVVQKQQERVGITKGWAGDNHTDVAAVQGIAGVSGTHIAAISDSLYEAGAMNGGLQVQLLGALKQINHSMLNSYTQEFERDLKEKGLLPEKGTATIPTTPTVLKPEGDLEEKIRLHRSVANHPFKPV